MSESDKETRNLLREKMQNFAPEPPTGMWERIGMPTNATEVKQHSSWYKYAALILLFLLPLSYYLGSRWSASEDNGDFIIRENIEAQPTPLATKELSKSQGQTLTENEETFKEVPSKSLAFKNKSESLSKSALQNPVTPKGKQSVSFGSESESKNGNGENSTFPTANLLAFKDNNEPNFNSPSQNRSFEKDGEFVLPDSESTNNNRNVGNSIFSREDNLINVPVQENTNEVFLLTPINSLGAQVDTLKKPKLNTHPSLLEAELAQSAIDTTEIKEPSKVNWFVGILGGPNMSYRSIRSEVHGDLVNHRNAHETRRITHNLSFEVGMQWKRLVLTAGFAHIQKGEKYSFKGAVDHKFTNNYEYFTLPIHAGFVVLQGKRAELLPLFGFSVHKLHRGESSWLNPHNHSEVHMVSTHNNPFRNTGYLVDAQLALNVHLSYHWDLLLRGGYTYFLQSIYKSEMQLDHRPYSWDQNIGLRYNL